MSHMKTGKDINVHWLTTMGIAAIAICCTQIIHEGVHALACVIVSGELLEFSALHVDCRCSGVGQSKIVAGSSSLVNIVVGTILYLFVQRSHQRNSAVRLFLWLFMLMSWLVGAGYWLFSGVANIGDWAEVITGWEPPWLWRGIMAILGAGLFMFFVWVSLREWGKTVGGGDEREQIKRSSKIGVLSYCAVLIVIVLTGIFNPYGIAGLPAVAALMMALGGMSPLLWMMQWFQAKSFKKAVRDPLVIHSRPAWMLAAVGTVFVYAFILGRTLYF